MILKSVKLENIRSYVNQVIEFPIGSVLLSGDIGSGKSTILLAIEFVLFGIRRKDLSGASLLRHGKKQGSVELKLDLDGKEIIIKRVLKRGKEDVKQEAGYIITNGIKKEGTHIELKADVLNLLGYPKDLITKSKDLIYRYTVYTPQESMKQILMEDKDVRLDTLRKVFNIDKYKRIRENSQVFIRELREKRKNYEGKIEDLGERKKTKEIREKEVSLIDEKLKGLLPKVDLIKKDVKDKKELINKTEKEIGEFNKLNNELKLEELKLKNYLERRKNNKEEVEELIKEIEAVKKDLEKEEIKNLEEFLRLINDKESQLGFFQKTIIEINKKLSEFETIIKHSNETKEKIAKLDQCPICLQNVGDEHKKDIHEREDKNISGLEGHITSHKRQEEENKKRLGVLEKEISELRKKQSEIKAIMVKKESLKEKDKRKEMLEAEQEKTKKEVGKININKIELNKEIDKLKNIEKEYKKAKHEFDSILKEERELEISKKGFEVKKEEITKLVKMLEEEINKKLEIKSQLGKISQYQNWIEEYFVKLMSTMEKHVMLQVYREFNDLFQQWFNMLMEDETISVRLDDEFTPVIEQNGYETNIMNLSGGERTAVALAYRLALNKVINDVVSEIKTKDILILDEPTDGFSSEQLDKVRDVLEQLNIKQVIIVSHESKIESFVDSVIRINKDEHVSGIS